MSDVTIRDLRNHGGKVINRGLPGETVVITRSGVPLAESLFRALPFDAAVDGLTRDEPPCRRS